MKNAQIQIANKSLFNTFQQKRKSNSSTLSKKGLNQSQKMIKVKISNDTTFSGIIKAQQIQHKKPQHVHVSDLVMQPPPRHLNSRNGARSLYKTERPDDCTSFKQSYLDVSSHEPKKMVQI